MTTGQTDFFGQSRQIVERFLHSVVIVDDRAVIHSTITAEPATVVEPPAAPLDLIGNGRDDSETVVSPPSVGATDESTRFNAKEIVDGFAAKGMTCCVLQPNPEERGAIVEILSHLAKKADIIVLDWSMHGDHGEKALDLVRRLAAESAAQPLLVAVYTIDPDLPNIPDKIRGVLLDGGFSDLGADDEGFAVKTQYARFSVFAKPGSENPPQYASRVVPWGDLADRLTREFTEITAGLVSNCVLESLAEVRLNTHKMLNIFSSQLDAPYLTHRALLETPQDAEDFLVYLLAEELRSVLEQARVGHTVSMDAIRAWVAQKAQAGAFKIKVGGVERQWTSDQVVALLDKGIQGIDHSACGMTARDKKKEPHKLPLTQMLDNNQPGSGQLNERFAVLATLQSHHGKRAPVLTLGTLLEKLGAESALLYVCVQPRCDCVIRLDEPRAFPFLPLKVTSNAGDRFELVLGKEPDYKHYAVERKPYQVEMLRFKRDSSGSPVVTASEVHGEYCFRDAQGQEYHWIGELRLPHGLRLSNEFAGEMSRVGIDNFEWLRRWARESE